MRTKRALVCAPKMPEFDREGGSRRIFHLIELLREAGWAVSFVAQNAINGERYAHTLQQMGIATYASRNPWVGGQESLVNPETLIATGHFDLVLIAFWDHAEFYLPVVRSLAPDAKVVVDSIDLHLLRRSRSAFSVNDGQVTGQLDQQYASEMIRELNVYAASDAVLTVSQKESDLINDFIGVKELAYAVPDTEDLPSAPLPFSKRKGMLFIGNFRHPPNVQAVEWLCQEILPRVKPELLAQHPADIVGNGINEVEMNYGTVKDVRQIGWVPNVIPYLQNARISVIPLLYGAGTKRKLMQSLMVGTPCVSTSIGVEGLNLEDGIHVLVADDATQFAAAIEQMLTDEELWNKLRLDGRSHIMEAHGRESVRACFDSVFGKVMSKPKSSGAGVR